MIVGRFAPSPTGALHRGSLVAAIASYCDAKHQHGDWWLRIDDIDPPREEPEATTRILAALNRFGFKSDAIIYQSKNLDSYWQALHSLNRLQLLYPCFCTRKTTQGRTGCHGNCSASHEGELNLSDGCKDFLNKAAIRCRFSSFPLWSDAIQATTSYEHYDPVLLRKDGLVSYAMACAVDDSESVTHVVRGSDLMPTTSVQLALMQALGRAHPGYAHVPIAVNAQQQKLSKQTHAAAIDDLPILPTLFTLWKFLGQKELTADTVSSFWTEAIATWSLQSVPKVLALPDPVSPSLDQT